MVESIATAKKPRIRTTAKRAVAKAEVVSTPPLPVANDKLSKKQKKIKHTEVKKNVVRDSFTMPEEDYVKIAELKQAALKAGLHLKKSEILRAGLHALKKLSATQLNAAFVNLEKIKTGRPKKSTP